MAGISLASANTLASSLPRNRKLLLLNAFGVIATVQLLAKVGIARRSALRLVIWSVRTTTPLACFLVARQIVALLRSPKSVSAKRLFWYTLSVWSVAEAFFLVYIVYMWRQLDAQTTKRWRAVLTHSTEEKRRASMERYLLMITQVFRGGSDCAETDTPLLSLIGKRKTTGQGNSAPKLSSTRSEGGSPLTNNQMFSSGNLLMRSSGSLMRGSPKKREASVDDLLKLWERGSPKRESSSDKLSEQELSRLKILELVGWFHGKAKDQEPENPMAWLQRGNMEDWIAHYWFRGSTPEELLTRPREHQELRDLVQKVLEYTGLTDLPHGRNPQIRARLMMSDKLPVLHRPLFVYVGTAIVCPLMTAQVMRYLGFRQEKVGGLYYWHRGPRDVRSDLDLAGPRQQPLVFCHGLGVGLVPYYFFIARLSQRYSGELFVPEMPFMAMCPWETVPSAREVVAQMQDMLSANRHTAAHWVCHSFGCAVLSWMMKMSPSSVLYMTLMEPASLLVLKSDFISQVLWDPPKTAMDIFLRYLVFRELFTVNLLCRNVFWEQSQVWPEDLYTPCVVELAEDDAVVHSLFVRRLLEHERSERKEKRHQKKMSLTPARRALASTGSSVDVRAATDQPNGKEDKQIDIQYIEGFFHGQILFHRRQTEKLFLKMRKMVEDGQTRPP